MKKSLLLVALLSATVTVGNLYSRKGRVTPKLLGHQQAEENTEYIYEVSGEDIQDPAATSNLYAQTNLPYALCSKALCTIDETTGKAICVCPIYGLKEDKNWQKASVGPKNFQNTLPTAKNGKLETVVSNYSMANIENRQNVPQTTCRFKNPTRWANCFGVRCRVKYNNGKPEAVCACPMVKTKKFVSIGPKGKSECQKAPNQVWSAATKNQGKNNNYIMTEMYKK